MPTSISNPIHEQQLGAIVIAWSGVADCLEQLFAHVADLDDAFVVGVFVEKIRDGQLDEVVKSLAAQLEDAPRDAIRLWTRSVTVARKARNRYLHSVYLPMEHSDGESHLYVLGRRVLDRTNGTAGPDLTKLLSADLEAFALDLRDIQSSYAQLVRDHFPYAKRQGSGGDPWSAHP